MHFPNHYTKITNYYKFINTIKHKSCLLNTGITLDSISTFLPSNHIKLLLWKMLQKIFTHVKEV